MPSYRVTDPILSLTLFDVVGKASSKVAGFIDHAGLAESEDSQHSERVSILDMGPPLHGQDQPGYLTASIVGSASLNNDEIQKIKTFVDRHSNEHRLFSQFNIGRMIQAVPQMYQILPHAAPLYEEDGRYTRTRFSCAGFVLEAYHKARVRLVNVDRLPLINMETISSAYPQSRFIESGKISAEDLGLEGNGPWPVLLCGYLFHALNREPDIIRQVSYTPDFEDQFFN